MSASRTKREPPDPYISQIIKYVPTESIAAYQAVNGIAADEKPILIVIGILLLILTPAWIFFSTKEKGDDIAWHQIITSPVAFFVWLLAVGNPITELLFAHWRPIYGSVVFIVATTILIPLLGKIINTCFARVK